MKKYFIILFAALCLSGCSATDNSQDTLNLSKKQIENYNNKINKELEDRLWNYDENSNTFEKGIVETEQSSNYNEILNACENAGFNIKRYSGNSIVIATTELQHFNNDDAGKAYFYFLGSKLIGEYYKYNSKIYSLNEKNIFLKDVSFDKYEDTTKKSDFDSKKINIDFSDYRDIDSNGNIAVINDDYKLNFYNLSKNNKFMLVKSLSYSSEGLYPMDICFTESGSVVLLGKNDDSITKNTSQSVEYEDSHDSDTHNELFLKSWKIEFLDKNFKKRNASIDLDLSSYTSINVIENKLFLSRGNSIDIFEQDNNGKWQKSTQIMLKNNIEMLKFADIDNDGKKEAIAIDGMDLYVYEYNETFELLWKTNLSINSMKDSLYIEDLNGDGIKEIYIEDLSDTSAKYILEEKGFQSSSDGIEYLHKYIVGDFNNDGKADYIEIISPQEEDSESNKKETILHLAK